MKKYKFYYGIPHSHTSFSTGRGTPEDAFDYARKKKLDFLILTDHNQYLDTKILFRNKERLKWDIVKREADRSNKKHKGFLALKGHEISTIPWGHMNILNSEKLLKGKVRSLKDFALWLENNAEAIVAINHPGSSTEKLEYLKELDKYITLMEVGNGSAPHKYKRRDQCYYKLLDYGWHLGAINGQDNHRDNWGDSENLTVVIAEGLSTEALMDALRCRRTFSTESRTLKLVAYVGNVLMGGIVRASKEEIITLNIEAEDKEVPIDKVQIITNGGLVHKEWDNKKRNNSSYSLRLVKDEGKSWYVVKIIHTDGRWGISSPIFLEII